jgi:cell wall-associated NlpC family hydrolase
MRRRLRILVALLAVVLAAVGGAAALTNGSGEDADPVASAAAPAASGAPPAEPPAQAEEGPPRRRPLPVVVLGPGDEADDAAELTPPEEGRPARGDADTDGPSPSAPSDADVRDELRRLRKHAGTTARLTPDGQAIAPFGAPPDVQRIIAAGNHISRTPYKWGGGHGRWLDDGYDCSGSVSFALAAAGLLDASLVSGQLARWGARGPGRWVTIYANDGHVFMVVAGLRFDTSGRSSRNGGSRWQPEMRSPAGYAVRHPPGL